MKITATVTKNTPSAQEWSIFVDKCVTWGWGRSNWRHPVTVRAITHPKSRAHWER